MRENKFLCNYLGKERVYIKMKDICIDYCEQVNCNDCQYKNASAEEKELAYWEIIDKILRKEKD